jgi:hypothetical protein
MTTAATATVINGYYFYLQLPHIFFLNHFSLRSGKRNRKSLVELSSALIGPRTHRPLLRNVKCTRVLTGQRRRWPEVVVSSSRPISLKLFLQESTTLKPGPPLPNTAANSVLR